MHITPARDHTLVLGRNDLLDGVTLDRIAKYCLSFKPNTQLEYRLACGNRPKSP